MIGTPRRQTTAVLAMEELKRRNDQESLRRYLINEQCFPSSKDANTAPITMEELKKLVRIWKLNEQRNFWKTHATVDDIVTALLQHAQQIQNYSNKKPIEQPVKPQPPSELKPSTLSTRQQMSSTTPLKNFCGLKYFNREADPAELTISSRYFDFPSVDDKVDQVVTKWRSEDFAMKEEQSTVDQQSSANNNNTSSSSSSKGKHNHPMVAGMRNKAKLVKQRNLALHLMNYSANLDFKKTQFTVKSVQTFINVSECDDTKTVSYCMVAISNIAAEPVVRNILFEINAMHKITNMLQHLKGKAAHWAAAILFYYFSCDKETEDRVYSAAHSLLQVNGASKDPQARLVALYTLNNLMPCIDRQRVAEIIMRILFNFFDSSIIFQDRDLAMLYLTIMQNMSWFSNVQHVLVTLNIFPLLLKFAQYAINNSKDKATSSTMAGDIAVSVGKILQSFIQLPEQAANLVNDDFMSVLTTLMHSDNEVVLLQAVRVAVSLSALFSVRELLERSNLIKVVCDMLTSRPHLSGIFSREASRFIVNVTILKASHLEAQQALAGGGAASGADNTSGVPVTTSGPNPSLDNAIGVRYIDANIPEAIFAILKSNNTPMAARASVTRALQNIVAFSSNALKLVARCMEPMVKLLRDPGSDLSTALAAGYVLYNLSCVPECRADLVDSKVHVKVLDFVTVAKDASLKSAFLQILVQLTSSNVCVADLLKVDLIKKVEQLLTVTYTSTIATNPGRGGNNANNSSNSNNTTVKTVVEVVSLDVRRDISLMLLAVVAYAAADLPREGQVTTLKILNRICREPDSDDDIIENCANVLKFISAHYENFEELDMVVRCILDRGRGEDDDHDDHNHHTAVPTSNNSGVSNAEIADCISTVLYNMTCSERSVSLMLSDSTYVNVMIRILRTGKLHVQENIAHAMRTLCAIDKCAQLLLKEDILSDLVVIALLRTSSEEIKVICSEAFYNMLCHEPSRLDLLKGDLWWALMRLGRTDSQPVRAICVRALSDLSAPVDASGTDVQDERVVNQLRNMQALRDHHVLSFIRDLSTASTPDLLQTCLQVVHNLMTHFQFLNEAPSGAYVTNTAAFNANGFSGTRASYSRRMQQQQMLKEQQLQQQQADPAKALQITIMHEVVAAIRIAVDAFNRAPNIKCMRVALLLMLKCAQMRIPGCENEFAVLDVVESLRNKKKQWILHPECRVYVSRFCYELARHPSLVKAISLSEMGDCLAGTLIFPESAQTHQKTLPPTAVTNVNLGQNGDLLEMVENALSVLMSYLSVCASAATTASNQAAAAAAAAAAGLAKNNSEENLNGEGMTTTGDNSDAAGGNAANAVAATASTAATSSNLLDVMQIIVGLEMWPILLQEGLSTESKILPKTPALGLGALVALLQYQKESTAHVGGSTPLAGSTAAGGGSAAAAKRMSVSGPSGLGLDMMNNGTATGAALLQPHPPSSTSASFSLNNTAMKAPRQTIHIHTATASSMSLAAGATSDSGGINDALQSVMTANAMALLNNNSGTATAILQGSQPLPLRVQAMALTVLSYVVEVQLHQMSLPKPAISTPAATPTPTPSNPSNTTTNNINNNNNNNKPAVGSGAAMAKTTSAAQAAAQAAQAAAQHAAAAQAARGPVINAALIQGIVRQDLLDHPATRHAVLTILHAVSRNSLVAGHLVTPEFFQLIDRFLAGTVGSSRFDKAQEFATSVLRHLALAVHADANGMDVQQLQLDKDRPGSSSSSTTTATSSSSHVPAVVGPAKGGTIAQKLVALPNRVLMEYIRDIIETMSGREVEHAALNIALFFYHMAHFLSYNEHLLNPKFVLDMIAKMSANEHLDKDKSVARHINQYTISVILNQYSFAQGVDPAFVQNMLQSFQNPAVQQAPETVAALHYHVIPELASSLAHPSNFLHLHSILTSSPLSAILTKIHPPTSYSSAIVAAAPVAQATLSLCSCPSNVSLLATMKDLVSYKQALLVVLEKFPANYDQWQAVLICDIKKNETVILKLSSPKPVIWKIVDLYVTSSSSSSSSSSTGGGGSAGHHKTQRGLQHSQSASSSAGGSSSDLTNNNEDTAATLVSSASAKFSSGVAGSSGHHVSHFHGVVHVYHKILRHFDAVSDSMVMLGKSSKSLTHDTNSDGTHAASSSTSTSGSSSSRKAAASAAGGAGSGVAGDRDTAGDNNVTNNNNSNKNAAGTITEGDEDEEDEDDDDDLDQQQPTNNINMAPHLLHPIAIQEVSQEDVTPTSLSVASSTNNSPSPSKRASRQKLTATAGGVSPAKEAVLGVAGAEMPEYSDTETEATEVRSQGTSHHNNNNNNINNNNINNYGTSQGPGPAVVSSSSVPATPAPTVITGVASSNSSQTGSGKHTTTTTAAAGGGVKTVASVSPTPSVKVPATPAVTAVSLPSSSVKSQPPSVAAVAVDTTKVKDDEEYDDLIYENEDFEDAAGSVATGSKSKKSVKQT